MGGRLPLFPLHTVLFPGAVLPLHIFEPRYRQLVTEGDDFGIVLIREGREALSVPEVHGVGTVAHLERVEALPDGRFNVLVRGIDRFRIAHLGEPDPYLVAHVESLPAGPPAAGPRLLARLEEYLRLHGMELDPEAARALAARAVWLAGAVLEVEPGKRQALLESGDAALAEQLLAAEIDRLRRHGRLAQVSSGGFSPN